MDTSELVIIIIFICIICLVCSSMIIISLQDAQEPPFLSHDSQGNNTVDFGGTTFYGQVPPNDITKSESGWNLQNPQKQPIAPGYFAVVSKRCGHCHTLIDNAQKAQTIAPKPFTFVFMEGDASPEAITKAEELNVEGYPTIWNITKNGNLVKYNGSRSPDALAINAATSG